MQSCRGCISAAASLHHGQSEKTNPRPDSGLRWYPACHINNAPLLRLGIQFCLLIAELILMVPGHFLCLRCHGLHCIGVLLLTLYNVQHTLAETFHSYHTKLLWLLFFPRPSPLYLVSAWEQRPAWHLSVSDHRLGVQFPAFAHSLPSGWRRWTRLLMCVPQERQSHCGCCLLWRIYQWVSHCSLDQVVSDKLLEQTILILRCLGI